MNIKVIALVAFGTIVTVIPAKADELFISFYNEDRVALYDPYSGVLVNSTFATLQSPIGLAVGPDHNLYVGSDNLAPPGVGAGIGRFAINGTTGASLGIFVDHGSDNILNNPQGLAFLNGSLFVADATSGVILRYDSAGTPSGSATSSDPILSAPIGLISGPGGKLFLADVNQGNVLSYDGASTFSQVNSLMGAFVAARDVAAGPDGNLYVLDVSGTGGIHKLNPADGSSQKIVDYSTDFFQASNLAIGPDGKLYVSGQDLGTAEGEVLRYNLDGSGRSTFADTGFGTSPGFLVFNVPEPTAVALGVLFLAGICFRPKSSH